MRSQVVKVNELEFCAYRPFEYSIKADNTKIPNFTKGESISVLSAFMEYSEPLYAQNSNSLTLRT